MMNYLEGVLRGDDPRGHLLVTVLLVGPMSNQVKIPHEMPPPKYDYGLAMNDACGH